MKNNVKVVLLILWVIIIFVLTGYPSLKVPCIKDTPLDKFYHVAIFFILGILEYPILKKMRFFLLGGGIVLFAELQQLILPGRKFEIFDIGAGIFGLFVAYLVLNWRSIIKNAIPKT